MNFDKLFIKCKKDNDYLAIIQKMSESEKNEFVQWMENSDLAPHYEWMLKPIIFDELAKLVSNEQKQQFLLRAIAGEGLIHLNSIVDQGYLSNDLRNKWFEQFILKYAQLEFPFIISVMESILTDEEKIFFLHDLGIKIIHGELNRSILTQLVDSFYMHDVVRDIPPEQKKEIYLAIMRQIPFEDLRELPFIQYLTPQQINEYLSANVTDANWQLAIKADLGVEFNQFYQFKLSLDQKKALYEVAFLPRLEYIIKNGRFGYYLDHLTSDEEKEYVFNVFWPMLKDSITIPEKFWDLFQLIIKYQFPKAVQDRVVDELQSVIQMTHVNDYHFCLFSFSINREYANKLSPDIQERLFEIMLPQLMQSVLDIRDAKKRLTHLTEIMNDVFVFKLKTKGQSTIGYGSITDEQSQLLNPSEIEQVLIDYKAVFEKALFDKTSNHQKFEFFKIFPPIFSEMLLKNVLVDHIQDVFKDKFDFICLIRLLVMSPPHSHEELVKQIHAPITNALSRDAFEGLLKIYAQLLYEVNDKLDRHVRDIKNMHARDRGQTRFYSFPQPLQNLLMKDGVLNLNELDLRARDDRHTQFAQYQALKNDHITHERRLLIHDIEDFVLSDLGKKLLFAQQFIKLFPEDKGFINAWLSDGSQNISQLFKDWISKQGFNALNVVPLLQSYPPIVAQMNLSSELPIEMVVLKDSCLAALEKDLDVENAKPISSVWSIFSGKKTSGFDESLRPEYIKFVGHLMKLNSTEDILSSIQQFHEKYPQFVNEKFGGNIPETLQNYFISSPTPASKK